MMRMKMFTYPRSAANVRTVSRTPLADIKDVDFNKYGSGMSQVLAKELLSGVIEESARLIDKYYGLSGNNKNISIEWESLGDDTLGFATWDSDNMDEVKLYFSSDFFNSKDTLTDEEMTELRETVLHELTHAFQYASNPGLLNTIINYEGVDYQVGEFLAEGMAEFIAGGNFRTYLFFYDLSWNASRKAEYLIQNLNNAIDGKPSTMYEDSDGAQLYYIASYLATRYLDKVIREAGNELGLKAFVQGLQEATPASIVMSDRTFNKVLKEVTGGKFETIADFRTYLTNATVTGDGKDFYAMVRAVVQENPINGDAGMIGGACTGGEAQTRQARVDSLVTGNYKANPLADYGFTGGITIFNETPDEPEPDDEEDETPPESKKKKIPFKMLEGINIAHTEDGETRYLWRKNTITGEKTFAVPPYCTETSKNKTLVLNLKSSSFYNLGKWKEACIILSEGSIENKALALHNVSSYKINDKSLHVELDGAGALIQGIDYQFGKINGYDVIYWGNSPLANKLMAGDKMTISAEHYTDREVL